MSYEKPKYEQWADELAGKRERSSWWLVVVCAVIAAGALWGLGRVG